MKFAIPFRPRLLAPWSKRWRGAGVGGQSYSTGRDTLKKYSGKDFTADLIAGLTVGIVALPLAQWSSRLRGTGTHYPTYSTGLAMAFAIAAGVPPQAGIFTAVIGVPQRGIAVCTIMAGVILLVMGMTRMGMLNKS
jgi:sulfate permease, SulP family